MRTCHGQCKSPRTRDFTPEVVVYEGRIWFFYLHDTLNCPDRIKWRMNALQRAAQRLGAARVDMDKRMEGLQTAARRLEQNRSV